MCKFKKYTSSIHECRLSQTLRCTFFSKPGFLDDYIKLLSDKLGTRFAVRQLTDDESENLVDVDTVAALLRIPLDYIMRDSRTYIFNTKIKDVETKILISQYYILVKTKSQEVDLSQLYLAEYLQIDKFVSLLDIVDVSLIGNYFTAFKQENVWSILDRSAFGDLDADTVIDSRYADTHQREIMRADLIRCISKRENSEEEVLCHVFIKSIVSVCNPDGEKSSLADDTLKKMESCGKTEVTRCFSEEFAQ